MTIDRSRGRSLADLPLDLEPPGWTDPENSRWGHGHDEPYDDDRHAPPAPRAPAGVCTCLAGAFDNDPPEARRPGFHWPHCQLPNTATTAHAHRRAA